jgi:hemolysin III
MYRGERFNSLTHLVGAAAAVAGLAVLVVEAWGRGDPWRIVSAAVYGVTLFALYFFSMMYHSLRGRAKTVFRKLDHLSIYTLIAGTYTPFTLVTLRGPWGWTLFGTIWGLALAGIVVDLLPQKPARRLPLLIYLVMGWLCVIALKPLVESLPAAGFAGLLVGGLFYTSGVIFYVLDERFRHFHGIWHLFVLAGSASHYFTVLFYVV